MDYTKRSLLLEYGTAMPAGTVFPNGPRINAAATELIGSSFRFGRVMVFPSVDGFWLKPQTTYHDPPFC
jgi:hypothetical protein